MLKISLRLQVRTRRKAAVIRLYLALFSIANAAYGGRASEIKFALRQPSCSWLWLSLLVTKFCL